MPQIICKNCGTHVGLFAEAWCGDYSSSSIQIWCDLDGSCKAYHCVKVTNLKTYILDVKVKGKIKSNANKVEYIPVLQDDTERYWSDKYKGLMDGEDKVFDNVGVFLGHDRDFWYVVTGRFWIIWSKNEGLVAKSWYFGGKKG